MPERLTSEQAAARRALDEAALDEERLDDLLDGVPLQREQRVVSGLPVDRVRLADQCEIPHPAQQPAGDARRAAGAAGDLVAAVRRHADAEHAGAAIDDQLKLGLGIEIEPDRNAETVAQRIGEEAGPGGGADERELRQIELDGPRCRSLADDEIKLEILHGGAENVLDR